VNAQELARRIIDRPAALVTAKVWHYALCTVLDVHDGDTLAASIDLGQDIGVSRRSVRLAGIAARELNTPGGPEARDYLAQLLPPGTAVSITSTGWDKYVRIDGVVYLGEQNINQLLVTAGWAVPWDGNGAQPKPAWPRTVTP
jgi:endonuclease YncB( thermonuclease family)